MKNSQLSEQAGEQDRKKIVPVDHILPVNRTSSNHFMSRLKAAERLWNAYIVSKDDQGLSSKGISENNTEVLRLKKSTQNLVNLSPSQMSESEFESESTKDYNITFFLWLQVATKTFHKFSLATGGSID